MISPTLSVIELSPSDIETHVADLTRLLIDSVRDGAAIGFMGTVTEAEAQTFWRSNVRQGVETRSRLIFGAFVESRLVGSVQLAVGMPLNQPHRAEISKMIVHPESRRLGLGKALMLAALTAAHRTNKTLVTLDTRTGDISEALYRSVGFEQAGVIPDFAYDPDGKARHATTYMYRYL